MNSSIKLKKARFSGIKKKVIAQKFSALVSRKAFLLFFHYNGSKGCNWEKVKKNFWQNQQKQNLQVPLLIDCQGLFVPSNLYSMVEQQKELCRSLTKGPTLVIACSSAQQLVAVVEACLPPTFLVIGGLYNRACIAYPVGVEVARKGMQVGPINHLDIKRWVSLSAKQGNSLTHQGVFISFLQSQLRALHPLFLQPLLTLLHILKLSVNRSKNNKNKKGLRCYAAHISCANV